MDIYLKAELAQYLLLEKAWTRTLQGENQVKPWPWADTWPVARLQLPKYGIDLIVLSGASGRTLAFGPGHVSTSAQPGTKGDIHLECSPRHPLRIFKRRQGRRPNHRSTTERGIEIIHRSSHWISSMPDIRIFNWIIHKPTWHW